MSTEYEECSEFEYESGSGGGMGEEYNTGDFESGSFGMGAVSLSHGVLVEKKVVIREETVDEKEMLRRIMNNARDLQSLLAWNSTTSALMLLRFFDWNLSTVKERYFEDPERVLSESKVNDCSATDTFTICGEDEGDMVECAMCWDDIDPGQGGRLGCGHTFCLTCWKEHLSFQLKNTGTNAIAMTCPDKDCKNLCGETAISATFGEASREIQQYRKYILDLYTNETVHCVPCPTPGCNGIIHHLEANKQICGYLSVRCDKCMEQMCFGCAKGDHGPASCQQMVDWIKLESDESGNAKWVNANTKPCPKCMRAVEKNGGCNFMDCAHCKAAWCWTCGTLLKTTHEQHHCKGQGQTSAQQEDGNYLLRYAFFFNRFMTHRTSQKADRVTLERVKEEAAAERQRDHFTDEGKAEVLQQTAQVLIDCRTTLMHSYVYAFFLGEASVKATEEERKRNPKVFHEKEKADYQKPVPAFGAPFGGVQRNGQEFRPMGEMIGRPVDPETGEPITEQQQVAKMNTGVKKSPTQVLFEFNQQHLEYHTEMLSATIEKSRDKYSVQEIVDRTTTAAKMLEQMKEEQKRTVERQERNIDSIRSALPHVTHKQAMEALMHGRDQVDAAVNLCLKKYPQTSSAVGGGGGAARGGPDRADVEKILSMLPDVDRMEAADALIASKFNLDRAVNRLLNTTSAHNKSQEHNKRDRSAASSAAAAVVDSRRAL